MQPRLLSHKLAAQYCGVTGPKFKDFAREQGLEPAIIGKEERYDLRDIDTAIDIITGKNDVAIDPRALRRGK